MILDLIKIEYKKFKKSSVIQLLLALYVALSPWIIFSGREIFPKEVENNLPFTTDMFYEFPTIWEYQGYIGSWMIFIFLSFVAVHIVASEISNKTMRQSIINGWTKQQYFLSKVLFIAMISLVATIVYYVTCVIIGLIFTPNPSFAKIWDNDFAGFRYFLSCFGHLSFAFFLVMLVRKAGIALFLYLAYVVMIEPGIRWLTYFQIFKAKGEFSVATLYAPLNAMEDLFPLPVWQFAKAIPDNINIEILLPQGHAVMLTILFTAIFIGGAFRIFMKRDI